MQLELLPLLYLAFRGLWNLNRVLRLHIIETYISKNAGGQENLTLTYVGPQFQQKMIT